MRLMQSLSAIPYGEVVEVEQELISEGLPEQEILRLCDAHSAVLQGNVDLSASKQIPEGHPVDVITQRKQGAESPGGQHQTARRNSRQQWSQPGHRPAETAWFQ